MKKPQGYDAAQAITGEFRSIAPGGHICIVKQAKEDRTKTGKEVLIILFDIVEGESKDFYKEQFDRKIATNPESKWQGVYRQLTEGASTPFYKGMISAFETSNPGYKCFIGDNFDVSTLKGKLFGGVFGQEEYEAQNGDIKLATKCMFIRSVDQVRKGVKVPDIKRLNDSNGGSSQPSRNMFPPDEEIPF